MQRLILPSLRDAPRAQRRAPHAKVVWNGNGALATLATSPFLPPQAFYTNAGELLGDFNRDDVLDALAFDARGDRFFRVRDGRTGAISTSLHQM